jgi:hypothetical protein
VRHHQATLSAWVLRHTTPHTTFRHTYQAQHDFAQQHVLQRSQSPRVLFIVLCETLESLEKVRIASLVILLVRVNRTGL